MLRTLGAVLAMLVVPGAGAWAIAETEPDLSEASDAAVEAPATPAEAPAERAEGHVSRSAFTRAVVDREPTDTLDTLPNDVGEVSYFTELIGLAGQRVVHRWSYDGAVVAEVGFDVGGPRWRVYSTKKLDPSQLGEWSVSVLDAEGRTLGEEHFRYDAAPPPGGAAEPGDTSE